MIKSSSKVLKCFWLPPNYLRTCTSGLDANTIEPLSQPERKENKNQYFQKYILPHLRETASLSLQDNEKFLPRSFKCADGFRDIVNGALTEIYAGRTGYVFSDSQLVEILRFMPEINVLLDDDIYFVFR